MKKKWLWLGLGAAVVIGLFAIGIAKNAQGKVQAVQFARVRMEDITSRVRAPGKIEPMTQIKVSADIPGKIVRLAVKEGDSVRRGPTTTRPRPLWPAPGSTRARRRTISR